MSYQNLILVVDELYEIVRLKYSICNFFHSLHQLYEKVLKSESNAASGERGVNS